MAAGLPVVATKIGGIPEALKDGETGILIPPHSPNALARSLQKLLQNDELREKMGRAGRVRFDEQFRAEQMVALYNLLFQEVAGNNAL
jgi:glycosyltransferase involved in cell wall biosynthesis